MCRRVYFSGLLLGTCVLLSSVSICAHADEASQTRDAIECITPDGRETSISTSDASAIDVPAGVPARDTISCHLQEGRTIFIIAFPKDALIDRFTFINENAAAIGDFHIAVSNSHLTADSPQWVEVEGVVPFAHKRLFNLSMLGINARYMKLSFHVENTPGVTRVDDHLQHQLIAWTAVAHCETALRRVELAAR
jgi:hypothetical protein